MKALWAVDVTEFQAFLEGVRLQIAAGPVEDMQRKGLPVSRFGNTAVISLAGPMMKNPGFLRFFGFASTTDVRAALSASLADEEVSQIVLRIDSPGGTVDGTAELADDVAAAAQIKPVIAQSDGMIASAAYWVASQATSIFAGRMDLIGSIGVRMLAYDFSKMFEEAGIRAVPIDTGEFKSTGAMGTEITEEQEAYLQGLVDYDFAEFQKAVMSGRPIESFAAVGDGRVFTAPTAEGLGLIDRIQTLDQTMNEFRQQAARKRISAARLAYTRQ